MKTSLILFNAVSVVVYLLWIGYHYLKALGSAFGNANPATGPGDMTLLFVGLAISTAACTVSSFVVPADAARIVALAPVALVLLGEG